MNLTSTERLRLRWITFTEVRPFPRDTNEILQAVAEKMGLTYLQTFEVAEELYRLESDGLLIVHAQIDEKDIFEVRLNHEAL